MTTWNLEGMHTHIFMCNGSSCNKKDAENITLAIRDEIEVLGLDEQIHTTRTRCNGRCKDAPVVIAYPQGNWYKVSTEQHARALVKDLHHEIVKPNQVYELVEGRISRTEQSVGIKGISKMTKKDKA